MKAEIEKETDNGFGVTVYDQNGVKHKIGVLFDGQISGHLQDGYADDPSERTPDENEMVSQARRYARMHVYRETDHEPFPVEENLPGIERVKNAIEALSFEEFESYFHDLYRQVKGRSPSITRPVPLPDEYVPNDYIVFLVDVYLDDEGDIEAVSDIHLRYYDRTQTEQERWNTDPFPERTADARIQLQPTYVTSLKAFKELVVSNLRCQLRDCYIGAGLEPPAEYRVLGRGQDDMAGRYHNPDITVYEAYHQPVPIPGYDVDFDHGMGAVGKLAAMFESLDRTDDDNPKRPHPLEAVVDLLDERPDEAALEALLEDTPDRDVDEETAAALEQFRDGDVDDETLERVTRFIEQSDTET